MAMFAFDAAVSGTNKARVGNAFATAFGMAAGASNAQKEALVMQKLKDFAIDIVSRVEREAGDQTAHAASDANVQSALGGL